MASKKDMKLELNVLLLSREEWQGQILQTEKLRAHVAALSDKNYRLGQDLQAAQSSSFSLGCSLSTLQHERQNYRNGFWLSVAGMVVMLVVLIAVSSSDPAQAPTQKQIKAQEACSMMQTYYADLSKVPTLEAAQERLQLKAQALQHACKVEG